MDVKRFEIVGVLGTGAHGLVVLARDHADASPDPVGLKVLKSAAAEEAAIERMREEARILAWLSHPNIVKVHRLLEKDGLPIVVMEHVDGASAEELLADGPLPVAIAVAIAHEAAIALDAAYNAPGPDGAPMRIVHGDIKPGNLLVSRSGLVKVIDFGTAIVGAEGHESAERDVAALAASLTAMAGDLPTEIGRLVAEMQDPVPAARPPVHEVASRLAPAAGDLAAFAAERVPPIAKARSKMHFRGPRWRDLAFLEEGIDVQEVDLGAPRRALALRPVEAPEAVEPHLATIARRPPWAILRARPSPDALVEALTALKGCRDPRAVTRAYELTRHADARVVEAAWELLASAC